MRHAVVTKDPLKMGFLVTIFEIMTFRKKRFIGDYCEYIQRASFCNHNTATRVNFTTSKNPVLKSAVLPHRNIHKYTWTSPVGKIAQSY
jgi:hypothetical protein